MRFCSFWFELGRMKSMAPSRTTTPTASARNRFANFVSVKRETFLSSFGGATALAPVETKLAVAADAPGASTESEICLAGSEEVYSSR